LDFEKTTTTVVLKRGEKMDAISVKRTGYLVGGPISTVEGGGEEKGREKSHIDPRGWSGSSVGVILRDVRGEGSSSHRERRTKEEGIGQQINLV